MLEHAPRRRARAPRSWRPTGRLPCSTSARCGPRDADADDRTAAELHDALANEFALVDRWEDSADRPRGGAADLWREVGDPLREGDSMRLLSRTMWRLCRGAEAERASVAALATLEPLGPIARAGLGVAPTSPTTGSTGASTTEAILRAREAREVAEALRPGRGDHATR